jgi:hypothetical protein
MSNNKKALGLNVNDLLITQAGLRHKQQLTDMIRFVADGGAFDENTLGSYAIREGLVRVSPLIEVAEFEDGRYALHNGHHRLSAIFLGRNHPFLFKSEYFVRKWKYKDYTDIVVPTWVTPFDVRTQLRIPQLAAWKEKIREVYIEKGEIATIDYIEENKSEYIVERGELDFVEKFVAKYGLYEYVK